MTGCVNLVAQAILGVDNTSLYDGSWAEFGQKEIPDEAFIV